MVCRSDGNFDYKLTMVAYADVRGMGIFRKKHRHLPRMHMQQTCGSIPIKRHIFHFVIINERMLQGIYRRPTHHFHTFEGHLYVNKSFMCLKTRFLARQQSRRLAFHHHTVTEIYLPVGKLGRVIILKPFDGFGYEGRQRTVSPGFLDIAEYHYLVLLCFE